MNVDTRASEAAAEIRGAVLVDTDAGLDALVATHRRRRATGILLGAALAAVVAMAGQALLATGPSDPPEPAQDRSDGIVLDLTPEDRRAGRVGMVRGDSVEVLTTDSGVIDPVAMAVSPDGTALALVDGSSRLQVVDLTTREQWTQRCRRCREVTWVAPRHVAVRGLDSEGAPVTVRYRIFDRAAPREVRLPAQVTLSGLSPSGDRAVWVQRVGRRQRLVMAERVSGSSVPFTSTLTEPGETITEVRWSPHGAQIGYVVSSPGPEGSSYRDYRFATVLEDGSWGSPIIDLGGCACQLHEAPSFAWSPDGLEVVTLVVDPDERDGEFRVVTFDIVEMGALDPVHRYASLHEVAAPGGAPVAWGPPPS